MCTDACDGNRHSRSIDSPTVYAHRSVALSLTEDYAPSWGVWEGVRELVQNWHDGCLEHASCIEWRRCDDADGVQRFEAVASSSCIGSVTYDAAAEQLTLVNSDVALHRRVLLLGASRKGNAADAIGQFGEGMKVGALALLRQGRRVEMSTGEEHWEWAREFDPAFGVRVLTVKVSSRSQREAAEASVDHLIHAATAASLAAPAASASVDGSAAAGASLASAPADSTTAERPTALPSLSWSAARATGLEATATDTRTTICPLTVEEWRELLPRFLFLAPPSEVFRCELGDLLLDERLQGQLYVKGIWIADLLAAEGIRSGLCFRHLRLDRDRRAVLHTSDLESQAAAMWVRAIEAQPALAKRLYALLDTPAPGADVRRVAEFLSASDRPTAVEALAAEFFGASGADAAPLAAGTELGALGASIADVERRLRRRVVLVSAALMNALHKSPRVASIDTLRQELEPAGAGVSTPRPVAWATLEPCAQAAVRRAVWLARLAGDLALEVGLLDFVDDGADGAPTLKSLTQTTRSHAASGRGSCGRLAESVASAPRWQQQPVDGLVNGDEATFIPTGPETNGSSRTQLTPCRRVTLPVSLLSGSDACAEYGCVRAPACSGDARADAHCACREVRLFCALAKARLPWLQYQKSQYVREAPQQPQRQDARAEERPGPITPGSVQLELLTSPPEAASNLVQRRLQSPTAPSLPPSMPPMSGQQQERLGAGVLHGVSSLSTEVLTGRALSALLCKAVDASIAVPKPSIEANGPVELESDVQAQFAAAGDRTAEEFSRRELLLRRELQAQEEASAADRAEHARELEALGVDVRRLTQLLTQHEVARVNAAARAEAELQVQKKRLAKQLEAETASKFSALSSQLDDLKAALAQSLDALARAERELGHAHEAREAAEERASSEREAHCRLQTAMERELAASRSRLVERTERLLRLQADGGVEVDANGSERERLAAAAAEIQQVLVEERARNLCAVCLDAERGTVLLPCRHSVLCTTCAGHVLQRSGRCPLCRAGVYSTIAVFK